MPCRPALAVLWSLLAWPPHGVEAAEVPVDVELVLAVDVSRSMDRDEQVLQRDGYVAALRDPEVLSAIRSGFVGRIALTYVEWGGRHEQRVVVPWRAIEIPADIEAFAAVLESSRAERRRYTSISGGLAFAAELFEANDFEGTRRVIDVSGDGPNNTGPPVTLLRDALVADGIVINGLPLMLSPYSSGVNNVLLDLESYYEDCVIGGPRQLSRPSRGHGRAQGRDPAQADPRNRQRRPRRAVTLCGGGRDRLLNRREDAAELDDGAVNASRALPFFASVNVEGWPRRRGPISSDK